MIRRSTAIDTSRYKKAKASRKYKALCSQKDSFYFAFFFSTSKILHEFEIHVREMFCAYVYLIHYVVYTAGLVESK